MKGGLSHALRAFPTLLRVGLAEMIAYRTEFLIWILTTNLPLVMMGLWTAVASDGPVGRFSKSRFVAYYLATLIVRLLTSTWMVWELTTDIRQGTLATRLMRPLHPLLAYLAQHLAAVPLRALITTPLMLVLVMAAGKELTLGWSTVPVLLASLAGAWLILFLMMAIIGSLALFVDSATGAFEIWLGLHFLLSGYLIPLELLPPWLAHLARLLPFRYTLSYSVEMLVGLTSGAQLYRDLAIQWLYVAGLLAATAAIWRAGMRRFVAFGG
jgi:ABC-2 type transport system permease protein